MVKIAVIATDYKPGADILEAILISNGCETITIKPKPKSILEEMGRISRRRGNREVYFFVDKPIVEYTKTAAMVFGIEIEVAEILDEAETETLLLPLSTG